MGLTQPLRALSALLPDCLTKQAGRGWVSHIFVRRWPVLSVLSLIYILCLEGKSGVVVEITSLPPFSQPSFLIFHMRADKISKNRGVNVHALVVESYNWLWNRYWFAEIQKKLCLVTFLHAFHEFIKLNFFSIKRKVFIFLLRKIIRWNKVANC